MQKERVINEVLLLALLMDEAIVQSPFKERFFVFVTMGMDWAIVQNNRREPVFILRSASKQLWESKGKNDRSNWWIQELRSGKSFRVTFVFSANSNGEEKSPLS